MIVAESEARAIAGMSNMSPEELKARLEAVESRIRSITANDFRVFPVAVKGFSAAGLFYGSCPYLSVGDRVQASGFAPNDGLYDIEDITEQAIALDRKLYDTEQMKLVKVSYPADVRYGVLKILEWEQSLASTKAGIASETISRHSVSYSAQTWSCGYPESLVSFLKPYMKGRF